MQPQILPLHQQVLPSQVDYTSSVICRHYTIGNFRYHFTLFPESNPDDGDLVRTGRYFAVLLTPKGLRAFFLSIDKKGKYIVDDADDEVAADPLTNQDGFITEYAKVLLTEVRQRLNFVKDCLAMINKAIVESKD